MDFNNITILGGFVGGINGETDPLERNPELNVTVLSGSLATIPVCGSPSSGNCFLPNGNAACDDADCCEAVCALDPNCCDVEWDQDCADLAFSVCGSCGDSEAGSCTSNNGTPGCDDADCCAMVCAALPECCLDVWDGDCATQASRVCGTCGPGAGRCSVENGTPGCDDAACCSIVCDSDPACCDFPWDEFCVDAAAELCDFTADPPVTTNAFHVVIADGVNLTVRLDGFTITGGVATGINILNDLGGGMFIIDASPAVVRCIFINNSAPGHGGGAIAMQDSGHPMIVNCQFLDNVAA